MPTQVLKIDRADAPTVRQVLAAYSPRVSFSEKTRWFSCRLTVQGEEPYLSAAMAEVDQLLDELWWDAQW